MAAAGGRESRIGHLTWTLSSRREYVDDGLREGDRSPPRGQLESFGVDVTVLFRNVGDGFDGIKSAYVSCARATHAHLGATVAGPIIRD
ncbi:hypothetical protein IAQ61_010659 [Plenodomus lingam]|uniref:uncharacterized protein n=1 Tax=Leptosphaeria maculans TaxID=5022 RepID=UPI0033290214|nr:hypothetical protein IAQ61_010659 [Plenodomus lingam]